MKHLQPDPISSPDQLIILGRVSSRRLPWARTRKFGLYRPTSFRTIVGLTKFSSSLCPSVTHASILDLLICFSLFLLCVKITIHLPFIGISRENRKFLENFLFCFDFTINSKYVILFHFKSNQGGKGTLSPSGGKVALPPSNKGEQKIFRNEKGCNWIQNGIKNLFTDKISVILFCLSESGIRSIPGYMIIREI